MSTSKPSEGSGVVGTFRKAWITSTADSNLTLHGFRRFKTTHLLNLRFLENEVAELDQMLYQAGLSLGLRHSSTDRLGLKHCKRGANSPNVADIINDELLLKLRHTIKQYGRQPCPHI